MKTLVFNYVDLLFFGIGDPRIMFVLLLVHVETIDQSLPISVL